MLDIPGGLILVSGPTGSGKTTTLYACLRHLNNGERKIHTIEDPIEYAVPGLRQSQINTEGRRRLSRAAAERAPPVARRDPDRRDPRRDHGRDRHPRRQQRAPRAGLGARALRAGGRAEPARPGRNPHFLSSSLQGVIAQRLVRTLCAQCKVAFELDDSPRTFDEVRDVARARRGPRAPRRPRVPRVPPDRILRAHRGLRSAEDHPRAPPADRRGPADRRAPRQGRAGRAPRPPPRRLAQGRTRPDQRRGSPPRHPARRSGARRIDVAGLPPRGRERSSSTGSCRPTRSPTDRCEASSHNDDSRTVTTCTQPRGRFLHSGSSSRAVPTINGSHDDVILRIAYDEASAFLHATLHANHENCGIPAIVEKRKSVFSQMLRFSAILTRWKSIAHHAAYHTGGWLIPENRFRRAQAGLIPFPFGAMVNMVVPASAPPAALVRPLRTVI